MNFEGALTTKLRYEVPGKLFEVLCASADKIGVTGSFGCVVDAGCGTGLSGEPFQGRCTKLIGIDLSEGMLVQASNKRLYNSLLQTDIVKGLDVQEKGSVDVILSADTLVYVGPLDDFFRASTRAASQRCILTFSVESLERALLQLDEAKDGPSSLGAHVGASEGQIVLQQSGRYAHSHRYVMDLASSYGWSLLIEQEVVGRYDESRPVWMKLYAFSRES